MTKFLSKYFKPSQISLIYIVLALCAVFIITILFSNTAAKKEREYYEKPIKTVISAKNTREIGVESINKQVIGINDNVDKFDARLEQLEGENKKAKRRLNHTKNFQILLMIYRGNLRRKAKKQKTS
ncbi:hypothetical protein [Psychromonas sp. KJ10-2]|uniref:hypothetical protein n=1 Tax=Psychromonas sp. KJ10-2 TaxID=3391822 RepID=UPI0039B5D0B3